ncbi:MAG: bacillithiol system redox-active protein YtxJ [Bacteroidetes bacterium]|jgi:bacillithiol system protein YtxJ|nr:bacillithiol system redox-active protein YtxJ [Bacteroidota bacterium]
MAFLDWFSSTALPEHWDNLTSSDDLKEAIRRSDNTPVAIFKHSTRCGISHEIMSTLSDQTQKSELNIPFYYLDLIAHRDLSQAIAQQLDVPHQSPQLILIHKRKAINHASHHAIDWSRITSTARSSRAN